MAGRGRKSRTSFLSLAGRFLVLGGVALVTFLAEADRALTQGGGSPTDPVPSVRILRGEPLDPADPDVIAFYSSTTSTDGLCRDFGQSGGAIAPNAAICPTAGRPVAPEIVELARALRGGPDMEDEQEHVNLVYEYIRNRIDTEFQFGTHKGALGVIIDGSGTPFDQAQLMVELLRASGMTASYRYGTIELSREQFQAWTGISQARAACEFLAAGGIPATVNGSVACAQTGEINSTGVEMAHVWVRVPFDGGTFIYDPSYKSYEHIATLPTLAADMGLSTGEVATAAQVGMGGSDGAGYVTNQNDGDVAELLQEYSENLIERIRETPTGGERDLRGADIWDIVGGREIIPAERPSGGWRPSQPSNYHHTEVWSGDIPDVFRATLTVAGRNDGAGSDQINVTFFVDEIYGRKLQITPLQTSCNSPCTGYAYAAQLTLDDVVLVAGPGLNDQGHLIFDLTLTADHPFAADEGEYADAVIAKSIDYIMPATIVHGWGATSPALSAQWEREQGVDRAGFFTLLPGGTVPETPPQLPSSGDLIRARMAANWLAQFNHARDIHAELANSRLTHLHSVGVVSTDINPIYPIDAPPGGDVPIVAQGFSMSDETAIIDVETSFALTHRLSGSDTHAESILARRAAVHAVAATASTLEGSVLEQMLDTPDVASTSRRFAWGNSPEVGETPYTTSREVMRFNTGNVATASGFLVTEGLTTGVRGPYTPPGGETQESIDPSFANQYRARLLGAIQAYVGDGYDVISSTEALLGPGHRHGTEYLWNISFPGVPGGDPIQEYRRHPTLQAGGALIATQYDSNGDPTAIAHTLTRYSGLYKGGGGPAVTQAQSYDPNQAADILRDRFEDRGSIHGVNIASGTAGYTSPTLETIGQGEFPFRLDRRIELRGAGIARPSETPPDIQVEDVDGVVTNWHGSVNVGGSGLEGMGASRPEPAAATIAAFAAMQDVWRGTYGPTRELTGMLVADWWGRSLIFNVVTLLQGAQSEQYVRIADGSFLPASGGAGSITLGFTREAQRGTLFIDGQPNPNSEQREPVTRWWSYESTDLFDDDIRITARGPQGDERHYLAGGLPTRVSTTSVSYHFHLEEWEFPYGVTLTLEYPGGIDNWQRPSSVTSNLGFTLDLPELTTVIPSGSGATLSATDMTGGITGATFRPLATRTPTARPDGTYLISAIYTPEDAVEASVAYTYDTVGRISEARDRAELMDPDSRGPHLFYVAEGYRGERQDPLGGRYAVETMRSGEWTRHIELISDDTTPLYRVTTTQLDGRGRVERRTYPEGNAVAFTYDLRDNVASMTRIARPDPEGDDCTATGVNTGASPRRFNRVACADIVVTALWHDDFNKPIEITDIAADGVSRTTEFEYRETGCLFQANGCGRGLLIEATRPDPDLSDGNTNRPIFQFEYDDYGLLTSALDPDVVETRHEYASSGPRCRTATETGWAVEGIRQTFENDARCWVTRTYDARGTDTSIFYEHDAMGRVTREQRPETGQDTRTAYDTGGRPIEVRRFLDGTSPTWAVSRTGYTPTGQTWWASDPAGDTVLNEYDAMDRLIRATDPEGLVTEYDYDLAGQLLTETRGIIPGSDPGSVFVRYGYTLNGQQAWIKDGERPLPSVSTAIADNTATMAYDGHDRLLRTSWPADSSPSYNFEELAYDLAGNVTARRTREGLVIRSIHDRLDRRVLEQEFQTDGATAASANQSWRASDSTFVYSLAGRMRDADNIQLDRHWSYDTAGRPISHDRSGTGGDFSYEYDPASNLVAIDHGGGIVAGYEYDDASRMVLATLTAGGSPAGSAELDYDTLDRRTSVTFGDTSTQTYAWELDGDLISIDHVFPYGTAGNVTFTYAHDRSGRQTGETISNPTGYAMMPVVDSFAYGTPTELNTYPTVDGVTLSYVDQVSINPEGLVTDGAIHRINADLPNGASPPAALGLRYRYDAHGNLRMADMTGWNIRYLLDALGERDRTWHRLTSSTETTVYTHSDGLRSETVSERLLTRPNSTASWTTVGTRSYVLGPLPDERLIYRDETGSVFYPHTDRRGSTIALSQGGIAQTRFAYDEFGQTTVTGTTGYPFRYTGQRWDQWTLSYHYKAREYVPFLGRFLQPDPLGFVDGPNVYAYVGNSPWVAVDTLGSQSVENRIRDFLGLPRRGAPPRVTVEGGTRAQRDALLSAIRDVQNTERAGEMRDEAVREGRTAPIEFTITDRGGDAQQGYAMGTETGSRIWIDMSESPLVSTEEGDQPASLQSRVAHELGHAYTGTTADSAADEMRNIRQNENPIREELGEPERLDHSRQGSVRCIDCQ